MAYTQQQLEAFERETERSGANLANTGTDTTFLASLCAAPSGLEAQQLAAKIVKEQRLRGIDIVPDKLLDQVRVEVPSAPFLVAAVACIKALK
jgi:hypothetical protein